MSKTYSIFQRAQPFGETKIRALATGFSWYALLLTPFWALHRGGWRVFLAWLAIVLVLEALPLVITYVPFWPYLVVSLFFGFSARDFERADLRRKGFKECGMVLADNAVEAEIVAIGCREPRDGDAASGTAA